MINHDLKQAPLGKKSTYVSEYQPDLLFPIERKIKRADIGIHDHLPFQGADVWNGFELSWLNSKGKPVVAAAEFIIPADSSHLIESKSFKLYLNSFNNSRFDSFAAVEQLLIKDLSAAAHKPISVKLFALAKAPSKVVPRLTGLCLDELDVTCDTYTITPAYLKTETAIVTETLYSDLLKSNCLVTGQPDWGSVQITYTGKKIDHDGLLKYIVSFRNHDEFGEHCVERIFMDISKLCQPEKLFVYARYTRRGGLDINPYRANYAVDMPENDRLIRQ